MWTLQMERKSPLHSYFGSYPGEYNNKVQRIIWNILSLLLTIRTIRTIFCYFIALRGNVNTLHTASDTHLLRLLKGWAVSPVTLAGACGSGGHSEPMQLSHWGWVGPEQESSVSLQRASNLNFSHSNWRQIIRQGWRMQVSAVYSQTSFTWARLIHSGLGSPKMIDKRYITFVNRKRLYFWSH